MGPILHCLVLFSIVGTLFGTILHYFALFGQYLLLFCTVLALFGNIQHSTGAVFLLFGTIFVVFYRFSVAMAEDPKNAPVGTMRVVSSMRDLALLWRLICCVYVG